MSTPDSTARPGINRSDYAGIFTRGAAHVLDLLLIIFSFSLGVSIAGFLFILLTQWEVELSVTLSVGVTAGLVAYGIAYFWYSFAAFGQSLGMATLGIRVVMGNGSKLGAVRALVRIVALPVLFALTLGLSTLGILVGKRHRALHDVVAGTIVVYNDVAAPTTALRLSHAEPEQLGLPARPGG